MRKVTFWLLWLLVFSVPWELAFAVSNVGSMSRLLGIVTAATGLLTAMVSGRVRRPGVIVCLSVAFTLLSVSSLIWSISPGDTINRSFQYVQLLIVAWLVRELARTREKRQSLMAAYCLGGYVSIAPLMMNFISGQDIGDDLRYSANNLDANDLGVTLAIGIPMAWYLFLDRARLLRTHGAIYVPLAVLAILLTASRGAFLAGLVALSIIPITLPRRSFRSAALSTGVVIAAAALAAFIVPESSWTRVFTVTEVVTGGTMSGRVQIWEAGLQVFQERQMLGAGAGAFETAVEPLVKRIESHNVFLAILVEQGIVGVVVFGALLAACAICVYRLPPLERKVFGVIGLTCLVGGMSLSRQNHKTTWLIFGLISAQSVVSSARARSQSRHVRAELDVHGTTVLMLQGDEPLLPQRPSVNTVVRPHA